MDRYPDFGALAAHEKLNRDYRIRVRERGAVISIMAPHGGRIEPGTSLAAERMAGGRFNLYCFEGIKEADNGDLHIASHRFDEPRALALIAASDVVVTVHACRDKEEILYVGGQFDALGSAIRTRAEDFGVRVSRHHRFLGLHPCNICNLGRLKKGVQLEISRGLRDNKDKLLLLSDIVHGVLREHERQS